MGVYLKMMEGERWVCDWNHIYFYLLAIDSHSSKSIQGNIVGLKSTNAVILATDSKEYEMYLIDDRI